MKITLRSRIALLCACAATALTLAGGASALDGENGYTATPFVTGFSNLGDIGPIGLAFDSTGQLFAVDYWTNWMWKFGPSGGSADVSNRLTQAQMVGGWGGSGITFDKQGRLYVAEQTSGQVLEVDPATGVVLRVVASVPCATGIATDPVSGDLFVTTIGCTSTSLVRVSNYEDGPGTVTDYGTGNLGSLDGISLTPDGTMYVAVYEVGIAKVAGTNAAIPGGMTYLGDVPDADGIAFELRPHQDPILWVNRNDGTISRIDFTTTPATFTTVADGGSRGDFVAVGPDGCFYATQTDSIWRVTNRDGSCSLAQPLHVATAVTCGTNSGVYGFTSLSATLTSATGPLSGKTVTFVAGGVTLTGTTDANGVAAVTSAQPATGSVDVSFAGDGSLDPSHATCALSITSSAGMVTAGTLKSPSGRGGLVVTSDAGGIRGELEFQTGTQNLHARAFSALGISPDGTKAWFAGTLTDGRAFTAYVEDNGEPGKTDVFRLWVAGSEVSGGAGSLAGGNVQIHR